MLFDNITNIFFIYCIYLLIYLPKTLWKLKENLILLIYLLPNKGMYFKDDIKAHQKNNSGN